MKNFDSICCAISDIDLAKRLSKVCLFVLRQASSLTQADVRKTVRELESTFHADREDR